MPRGEFKHRYGSLPTLQISLGIVALFEKIYDSELILAVVSNIGENVVMYSTIPLFLLSEKRVASLSDTMPILENIHRLQIIETGFSE
jgi:hypothetical protein